MPATVLRKCALVEVLPAYGGGSQDVEVVVEHANLGLAIKLSGYGCYEDDDAAPIYLERHRGRMRLLVWTDINNQEPTHIIDLENARVEQREPEAPCTST